MRIADAKSGATAANDLLFATYEALAVIVGLAAHEVPGVVGMVARPPQRGPAPDPGRRPGRRGGVGQPRRPPASAALELHLVVAAAIRQRVACAALLYAAVEATEVRIHVAGVSCA